MRKLALFYLIIPAIIFVLNWCRSWMAGLFLVGTLFSVVAILKAWSSETTSTPMGTTRKWLGISLALAVLWVAISGIGGFGFQNWDFNFKNAVLRDLVQQHWPVEFSQGKILVYYVSYWMPAALVGKAWSLSAANVALYLWTVLGCALALFLFAQFSRKPLRAMLIFIFFSGMDLLGYALYHAHWPLLGEHLEWWASLLQYSSNTTQLFWVFNQALPAWIATLLLLGEENPANGVALAALMIPFAPLPAMGILPILLAKTLAQKSRDGASLRSWISLQNVFLGSAIPLIFGAYFLLNEGTQRHGFLFESIDLRILGVYVIFCALEFALLAAILLRKFRHDLLFVTTVATLLLIPCWYMGRANDFCMRVSIPALVVLAVYVVRFVDDQQVAKGWRYAVWAMLLIGALTPAQEMIRSVQKIGRGQALLADNLGTLGDPQSPFKYMDDMANFIASHSQGSFYQVFIRPR